MVRNRMVDLGSFATRLEGLLSTLETSFVHLSLSSRYRVSRLALLAEVWREEGRNLTNGLWGRIKDGLGGGFVVDFRDALNGKQLILAC